MVYSIEEREAKICCYKWKQRKLKLPSSLHKEDIQWGKSATEDVANAKASKWYWQFDDVLDDWSLYKKPKYVWDRSRFPICRPNLVQQ